MALATLPYKYNITSKTVVGGNTDVTVTFNILDGTGATVVSGAMIFVSPTISPEDFFDAMRAAVLRQMLIDAGSAGAFLTAMVGKTISITQ